MSLSRQTFLTRLMALGGATFLPALSWAQSKLADVVFPNEVSVSGQKLFINGYGMRFRFGFRIYAAAFYTPTKLAKNEEVLKGSVAKRLHLVAQRDVKGDDFGKLFTRSMEDNMSKEDFSKIINGVLRMSTIFSQAKQFGKGETILVDFVPGTGLVINFRNKQQGEPIKEPEFADNFFKIWFGQKPADESLRRALLGEQNSANTGIN